jgi:Tol biopolymer transport system component
MIRASATRLPGRVRVGSALVAALSLGGCIASVDPILPQDVAAALAREPMRRLDTTNLSVYYPAARHDEAVRFAGHVEGCARQLEARQLIHNGIGTRRMTLILPELTFNNAFTSPIFLGHEPFAVVPTYQTVDQFMLEMGLPPDAGTIACHELTHYVHFQQVAGLAFVVDLLFGEQYTPQIGFDSWFDEGLAVYYETTLQPGVGRLAWPFWHGAFAAGVAGRRLQGGDLSEFNRDAFALGNNYLVGSHFIRFLAERYGEWRLWQTIAVQARSIFYPLGINLRFWQAYDKSLETLFAEFADDVARHHPAVGRPAGQRIVEQVGAVARYGRAVDGSEALIVEGHDTPVRIVVRGADGRVRVDRNLIDVAPPRTLVTADADSSGPPSFTADGRYVYFTTLDSGVTFERSRLMRLEVATGALSVVARDLYGGGGSISPDGKTYAFSRENGDHHDLCLLDVASGNLRLLAAQAAGAFVALPRYAPDGRRLVATVFDGAAFSIRVFDAESGKVLAQVTDGRGAVHDASWADATHVVYLGAETREDGFQVYLADLGSGQSRQLTHAPYLAFEPQMIGASLRFLNREGWRWTLDEQTVSLATPPAAPAAALMPAPPPGTAPQTATGPQGAPAPTPYPSPYAYPYPTAPVWPIWPLAVDGSPVQILNDAPYKQTDHLFGLQTHAIDLATAGRKATLGIVSLGGADRLQFHRWALDGIWQLYADRPGYGGSAAYANQLFAPFSIVADAMALRYHDTLPVPPSSLMQPTLDPAPFVLQKTILQADLFVSRELYGAPAEAGFHLVDDDQPGEPTLRVQRRRAAGPFVQATYSGVESTPYSGVRRALIAVPSLNIYPGAWNSTGAMLTDARLELTGVTPLPLSHRHRLALDLRGRDLFGLPPGARWLQVGGGISALAVNRHPDTPVPPQVTIDGLPGITFVEPLRGYEDYPIATDRIFIAEADYRYPLIIDRGTASTLWLLPSSFLRQIDLELFGSAATDAHGDPPHAAGGTAVTLEMVIWDLPLNLTYQLARRVEDDRALVQIFALSAQ